MPEALDFTLHITNIGGKDLWLNLLNTPQLLYWFWCYSWCLYYALSLGLQVSWPVLPKVLLSVLIFLTLVIFILQCIPWLLTWVLRDELVLPAIKAQNRTLGLILSTTLQLQPWFWNLLTSCNMLLNWSPCFICSSFWSCLLWNCPMSGPAAQNQTVKMFFTPLLNLRSHARNPFHPLRDWKHF